MNQQDKSKHTEQSFYQWDYYSDQPYPIRDKQYKKSIRIKAFLSNIKTLLVCLAALPVIIYRYTVLNRFNLQQRLDNKIGLCINLDKEPEITFKLVRELGVKKLSIRVPLSDLENLDSYKQFAKQFMDLDILFVVLQDRAHIENEQFRQQSFERLFSTLSPVSNKFQIGNAINRTKWGFITIEEYLAFFETAQRIRDEKFPHIELFGSAVIDFEIHAFIRSLWHRYPITYDGVSSLLYVDRRGAPESKQFMFDLIGKINFFSAALLSSNKSYKRLLITETNWPIKDTKPYAPALGDVWVSETDYANYMLRYYLLVLANANVECVYWHQLIAPGYGLIDNRNGECRQRRAFSMFKFLIQSCAGARILEVEESSAAYALSFKNYANQSFKILWAVSGSFAINIPQNMQVFDATGVQLAKAGPAIEVGEEPVYLFEKPLLPRA